MQDIEQLAYSRIAEPLSKGENVKKLLSLHISPYVNQTKKAEILEELKSLEKSSGVFLEWFGILKGVERPHTTIDNDKINQFINVFSDDKLNFGDDDYLTKPLYFNQKNYFNVSDLLFKKIIESYCILSDFKCTVDEY